MENKEVRAEIMKLLWGDSHVRCFKSTDVSEAAAVSTSRQKPDSRDKFGF
jgi:hypothetical protein